MSSPGAHLMMSWLLSNTADISRRERGAITLCGVAPDIDGGGYLLDLLSPTWGRETFFYQQFHHVLLHNFAASLAAASIGWAVARARKGMTALLCFLAVSLHIVCDIAGSKGADGYQWPIPYFWPVSDKGYTWQGQWELNAWPNIIMALGLFAACCIFARKKGRSPFEVIPGRIDAAVFEIVQTLRDLVAHKKK